MLLHFSKPRWWLLTKQYVLSLDLRYHIFYQFVIFNTSKILCFPSPLLGFRDRKQSSCSSSSRTPDCLKGGLSNLILHLKLNEKQSRLLVLDIIINPYAYNTLWKLALTCNSGGSHDCRLISTDVFFPPIYEIGSLATCHQKSILISMRTSWYFCLKS